MFIYAFNLKTNITKLKTKVLEIDEKNIIVCEALDELYGLVERLNQLNTDDLRKQEVLLAQGFANRFITKQNKNKLSSEELINNSLLKNILMATYIIKVAYQNMIEPGYRTEAELAILSENISNLKEQKIEYEDLLEKAGKLSKLESSIDDAEQTLQEITEIRTEVLNYKDIISSKAETAELTLEKITKNHELSSRYIVEIDENNKQITYQIKQLEENEKSYQSTFTDLKQFIEDTKKEFNKQKDEIQEIIDDANRASMAGSFLKRKNEITNSIRLFDICTVVFLLSIVVILWIIFFNSYNQDVFSLTLFFSKIPITLPLFWLAWLASRKSAYLTRIREDYAYKYSSAMAFEGYKKQVQEISPELQERLLEIAVKNLGDNPIRLYKDKIKHTPIDLDAFFDLIKSLPAEKIEELSKLISSVKK